MYICISKRHTYYHTTTLELEQDMGQGCLALKDIGPLCFRHNQRDFKLILTFFGQYQTKYLFIANVRKFLKKCLGTRLPVSQLYQGLSQITHHHCPSIKISYKILTSLVGRITVLFVNTSCVCRPVFT